jgi:hypothetical protein
MYRATVTTPPDDNAFRIVIVMNQGQETPF